VLHGASEVHGLIVFAENLDDFLNASEVAHQVTIGAASVVGIFSNRAADALFAAGASPSLTVKSTDVVATARGTAVVVDGTSYTVAKIEHDGTGMARVLLEKT
jgi:hypothetical protein